MLNLHSLAERARKHALARAKDQDKDKRIEVRGLLALKLPFNERLIEACQRVSDNPKSTCF